MNLFLIRGLVAIVWAAAFVAVADSLTTGANPMLSMLAIYAATGGIDFLVQAWLLARRRRRLAPVPA